jgi:hypothetical protein
MAPIELQAAQQDMQAASALVHAVEIAAGQMSDTEINDALRAIRYFLDDRIQETKRARSA